jgi:hypothetical protein
MRSAIVAFAVLTAWVPVEAMAADDPLVMTPASAWQLDYGAERCSLARDFAADGHKVGLRIDNYGTKFGFRMLLTSDLIDTPTVVPITQLRIGYSPDTRERERFWATAGTVGEANAVWFRAAFLPDPPMPGPDYIESFERGITSITVQFGEHQPLRLDTGSMAEPFAAMRKCLDNLIASWGLDPVQHWAQSRPVLPARLPKGYRTLATTPRSDHPGYTERNDAVRVQAINRNGDMYPLRLMVDATGHPTACVVQVPVSEAQRKTWCDFNAGPFVPALDAAGKPMASVYLVEVR